MFKNAEINNSKGIIYWKQFLFTAKSNVQERENGLIKEWHVSTATQPAMSHTAYVVRTVKKRKQLKCAFGVRRQFKSFSTFLITQLFFFWQ